MTPSYLSCSVKISNGDIRFDVIEYVNVTLYISSVFRKQNVGDAILCPNSGFLIVFIVIFRNSISRACLIELLTKTKRKKGRYFSKFLISVIKFSQQERLRYNTNMPLK